jgi:hypothetical protein
MLAMSSLLLIPGSLLLAACGDDDATTATSVPDAASEGLTVIVEPTSAPPGSAVQASVRNDSGKEFTYGAGYGLEREADGSWEEVELPSRPVPEIGYVASPGKSGPPVEVILPDDLEPGSYRVVLDTLGLTGEFEVTDG